MRKIRFISFICVLALILSLCSVFSFAAAPEAGNQVYATNKQYVVALSGTSFTKPHPAQMHGQLFRCVPLLRGQHQAMQDGAMIPCGQVYRMEEIPDT